MLQHLLLAISDFAWAYNLTLLQYEFIGPTVTDVLGVTADELMANHKLWNRIIVSQDRAKMIQQSAAIKTDEMVELHYRIKVKGTVRWVSEKKARFTDAATGHDIIYGVIKDVSAQHSTDYYLKSALGNFGVLFEKNTSPMWIYEVPSLRILKVNDAAVEHYGYTREEFLSFTIRDIRPKIDLAKFNEYIFRKGIAKSALPGANSGGIWTHINKAGEEVYAEITGYEVTYNNTACRVVVATDVTERVRYERQRKQDEERVLNENAG